MLVGLHFFETKAAHSSVAANELQIMGKKDLKPDIRSGAADIRSGAKRKNCQTCRAERAQREII